MADLKSRLHTLLASYGKYVEPGTLAKIEANAKTKKKLEKLFNYATFTALTSFSQKQKNEAQEQYNKQIFAEIKKFTKSTGEKVFDKDINYAFELPKNTPASDNTYINLNGPQPAWYYPLNYKATISLIPQYIPDIPAGPKPEYKFPKDFSTNGRIKQSIFKLPKFSDWFDENYLFKMKKQPPAKPKDPDPEDARIEAMLEAARKAHGNK